MQNNVQKPDSVRLWNWSLLVDWINIWLVEDAWLEVTETIWQVKGHNWKMPPRRKLTDVKFKATMLELNFENIKKIFWWELTTLDAASNTETWNERKVLTYDDLIRKISMYPISFENKDADWKVFWVKIFQAYSTNSMNFTFPSEDDLETSIKLPIEFWAYPDENNKYYELIDEQDMIA